MASSLEDGRTLKSVAVEPPWASSKATAPSNPNLTTAEPLHGDGEVSNAVVSLDVDVVVTEHVPESLLHTLRDTFKIPGAPNVEETSALFWLPRLGTQFPDPKQDIARDLKALRERRIIAAELLDYIEGEASSLDASIQNKHDRLNHMGTGAPVEMFKALNFFMCCSPQDTYSGEVVEPVAAYKFDSTAASDLRPALRSKLRYVNQLLNEKEVELKSLQERVAFEVAATHARRSALEGTQDVQESAMDTESRTKLAADSLAAQGAQSPVIDSNSRTTLAADRSRLRRNMMLDKLGAKLYMDYARCVKSSLIGMWAGVILQERIERAKGRKGKGKGKASKASSGPAPQSQDNEERQRFASASQFEEGPPRQVPLESEELIVHLNKNDDDAFGVRMELQPNSIKVAEVMDVGLVGTWNKQMFLEGLRTVQPGDEIVCINGIVGSGQDLVKGLRAAEGEVVLVIQPNKESPKIL